MKKFIAALLLLLFSSLLLAGEFSQANNLTKTPEFKKMKRLYERCVLAKGVQYAKVSTPAEAIKFAPIACKRELLAIKKFFLNSAFKKEVINALVGSVKEGVEIDLINAVYNERLKFFK